MTSDALAPAAPHAKPNGWWGMVAFLTTEATLFGVLFGSYLYLRFRAVAWPPPGIPDPKVVLPLVLAVVLAATIVPMALAAQAAQRGLARRASALILVALVVQSAYFGVALHEFAADLDRFKPESGAYASIYYTLLGADHAHVAAGLLLNVWLLLRLTTGLTRYRITAVRAVSLYWYAVGVLTLLLTLCVISPAL